MPLLSDIDQMKPYYSRLSVNASFESFESFVRDAQDKYIVPLIGQEAVDELQIWIDTYVTPTPPALDSEEDIAFKALLPQVRRALTYYTLLEAGAGMLLDMGDTGLLEKAPDNTMGARQWVVNNFNTYLADNADTFAESLLSFLEAKKDDYETWDQSDFRKDARKLFIDNGKRLSDYVKVSQPRRFFLGMLQSIKRVEELYMPQITGQDLWDDLKTKLKNDELSPDEETLVAKIRPVVAYMAMADVLPQVAVSVTSSGVKVLSENEGIRNLQAASVDLVGAQVQYNLNQGAKYESVLRNYLNDNAELFEEFDAPSDSTDSTNRPEWSDNCGKNSFRFP